MGREDQIEEREVLDSIFPDEITDISETEFRIAIKLDLPEVAKDGDDDEEAEAPVILLTVRYPEDYPNVEPELDLLAPAGAVQHPLLNVAEEKEQLLAGLADTVQESLGMAMVFTLVSTLKEAAEQLIIGRQEAEERKREEKALAAEREENQKFHGTMVTPESFIRWRDAFVKEMAEKRKREEEERLAELAKRRGGGAGSKDGTRLTGRQLWERGLVGKIDEDDIDVDAEGEDNNGGAAGATEGVQKLKIEA
ncbi:rwd domain containing protein [Grosmannia clavigera kw1407]|uniref:Rwd domain containing protein n=1 Tax=Grosmannia clavigera (strain kw1407 / UAMH 11150) TaxID=655863 RepID=F0XC94_GROCL|nr:rwd domain containing protein [Grosmannia clavigera kw1407]EFX03809.1 rwd domain containing protein [Grosmannia clavigera kw1407]